jgi:hypothetical protein
LVDLIFVWLRDQCAKGPNNRWKLYTGRVLKSPENLFPSKSPREIKLGSKWMSSPDLQIWSNQTLYFIISAPLLPITEKLKFSVQSRHNTWHSFRQLNGNNIGWSHGGAEITFYWKAALLLWQIIFLKVFLFKNILK